MAKKKENCSACEAGYCGVCVTVLGILIILNSKYTLVNWSMFVGSVIVIAGLLKLLKK